MGLIHFSAYFRSLFHVFGSFFMDFWSFEVTFSDILVSWGRLSTCLVPWGGLGGQTLSVPRLGWTTFGSILGSLLEPKGDMFKVIFSIDF